MHGQQNIKICYKEVSVLKATSPQQMVCWVHVDLTNLE